MMHVRLIAVACALTCARAAWGQEPAPADQAPPPVEYEVEVTGVAPRTAASSSVLRAEMFSQLFVESPAEVLRAVPGLVIAQHAGGGKSDQYQLGRAAIRRERVRRALP